MVTCFILSTVIFADKVTLGGDSIVTSRQNCLFMTKLPHPPPLPSCLFTETPLRYVTLSTSTSSPSQYKTKFYDLKRMGVEVKKSLSSFICFFFSNTKKIICLKSKIFHYSQSLVQTGSIPSKTRVPLSRTISRISTINF